MRKYLIVVDMQNDFIEGALGNREAKAIVSNVVRLILAAKAENRTVFFTQDTHDEGYMDTSEGRHLPVPHCVKGTDGWKLHPDIAAYATDADRVIQKPAFASLTLVDRLGGTATDGRELDIALCGVCTDICVVSNALLLRAFFPEAAIRVFEDACAGVTKESHDAALSVLRACHVEVARLA